MADRLTLEEVKKRSKDIHGVDYDFSKVKEYKNNHTKMVLGCKKHGDFEKSTMKLLTRKAGCQKCSRENRVYYQTLDTDECNRRSIEVHGDTYDYSKVIYKRRDVEIVITCKIHGDFKQIPASHHSGAICPKCAGRMNLNNETYEEIVREVHNNYYSYPNLNYKGPQNKIQIKCELHGMFEQKALYHRRGGGCHDCARESTNKSLKERPNLWSHTGWQKAGEKSKRFDSFKVYILRCWNENEEFYKIGKTYTTIRKRFDSKTGLPYKYEIVKTYSGEAREISELEHRLQKQNKNYKYIPKLNFNGMYECFSQII